MLLGLLLSATATLAGCSQDVPADTTADPVAAMKLRKEIRRGSSASAAPEESVEQASGWSTLRGQFVFDGQVPPPIRHNISSDVDVCSPQGADVIEYPVIVDDATQGIAFVAVYVRKVAPENVHPDMAPGKTDPALFDQEFCMFKTPLLAVQTTQLVQVKNSDPVGHNTKIEAINFNNTVGANQDIPLRFQSESAMPMQTTCSIHPWMKAYILPRNNSYFAVTEADGTFEIPNLPAGIPLEFQVWQQQSGGLQKVVVNGTPTNWKSGRFTLTLAADEPTELKVTVPAAAFQ